MKVVATFASIVGSALLLLILLQYNGSLLAIIPLAIYIFTLPTLHGLFKEGLAKLLLILNLCSTCGIAMLYGMDQFVEDTGVDIDFSGIFALGVVATMIIIAIINVIALRPLAGIISNP